MPKWPVPVFCCFWFQESRKIIILGIGKGNYFTKFYTGRLQKPEGEQQGGHRGPTPCPGAGTPLAAPGAGVAHLAHLRLRPLPIYSPRQENPRYSAKVP